MPLILGTNSVKGGYDVANSLRFDDGSSDYLGLNPSTSASTRTFTYSFWTKRGLNAEDRESYLGAGASGDQNHITIGSDYVQVRHYAGGHTFEVYTSALFKDPSAWYHFVVAVDTTQGTAANRIKIYVNGTQVSSFSTATYPDQNFDFDFFQNGATTYIGRRGHSVAYKLNSYLCEVAFIDGSQLAATSFGEFDEDSPTVWKPKNFKSDVTFGNAGFYLEFKQSGTSQNSSGIGADTSGNDNHFAVTNLTAVDQSTDTCTNNFATMNPLNVPTSNAPTFAEGNLKTTSGTTGGAYMGSATIGVSSGKWYAEMKVKVIDSMIAGVSANVAEDARDSTYPGQQDDSVGILFDTGNKYISDSGSTHGDAFSADDILMIALDLDNNNAYFGRNGNWFDGSGNADESSPNSAISLTAAASTRDGFYFFSVGDGGGSAAAAAEWNFGSPMYAISSGNTDGNGYGNFEYAVPSGYFALCTKNLAEHG